MTYLNDPHSSHDVHNKLFSIVPVSIFSKFRVHDNSWYNVFHGFKCNVHRLA